MFNIEYIDDVLPHIGDKEEFRVVHKDDYSYIDYNYVAPDTFDHPAALECRGIKFHPDGRLMARPLHKFFNVGEKVDSDVLPWYLPHTIHEKLDGSMVHPAIVGSELRLMTRAGVTDTAKQAEKHLNNDIIEFCMGCTQKGSTPIFEYTGPDNLIVIKYDEPQLTLLAIRDNKTGEYTPVDALPVIAQRYNIPWALKYTWDGKGWASFITHTRNMVGKEGFVIVWEDGSRVKIKGDDYVLKHKAKDQITVEKNVLQLVLREELDDVLPILDEADAAKVEAYRQAVWEGMSASAKVIDDVLKEAESVEPYGVDRKCFATEYANTLHPTLRSAAFKAYDGHDHALVLKDLVLKACNRGADAVEQCRPVFNATY